MTTFSSRIEKFSGDLWAYHVVIPAALAQPFIDGDNRRVLCTLQGKKAFHAALMHNGQGDYFINLNKELRSKLGLVLGQQIEITLEKDTSEYGLPVPEELTELWQQDEEGYAYFHQLTPGKQRSLIYWTSTVKSPDKRMIRALVMLNHVKARQGKVDFKALNEELKEANQR